MPLKKPLKKLLKDAGFLPLCDQHAYSPHIGDILLAERRAWLCNLTPSGSREWVDWTQPSQSIPEGFILSAVSVGYLIYRNTVTL